MSSFYVSIVCDNNNRARRVEGVQVCAKAYQMISHVGSGTLQDIKAGVQGFGALYHPPSKKRRISGLSLETETQRKVTEALIPLLDELAEAMPHMSEVSVQADGQDLHVPVFYISVGLFENKKDIYVQLIKEGKFTKDDVSLATFYRVWEK